MHKEYIIKINALIDIYLIKDKLDKLNYHDKGAEKCIAFWETKSNNHNKIFNIIVDTYNKKYFATRIRHRIPIELRELKEIDLFEFLKL